MKWKLFVEAVSLGAMLTVVGLVGLAVFGEEGTFRSLIPVLQGAISSGGPGE